MPIREKDLSPDVLATHRVVIPDWRPWPDNKLAGGIHWATRKDRKGRDKNMVAAYARIAGTPKATGKRRVQLEIVLSGRQKKTDPMAYAKSLLDSLVHCGLLVDDTTEYVEWIPPVYRRGDETVTTIVLTDIEVV